MLQFKLVLLGDSSVGKSSIVYRFVKDSFDEFRESTIGAAFLSQTITLEENNQVIKFEIWDTAGQERYKSLAPMYYRNANAALVVYDVTAPDSLMKAKSWIEELKKKVGNEELVICLVGNKVDICEEDDTKRKIEFEEAKDWANDENLLFYEVSAKTGYNVKEVFQKIGEQLYEYKKAEQANKGTQDNSNITSNIRLQEPQASNPTSCC
ncbi:hypothetical protein TPHA_0I02780 [Tetrapisispora phaffii CBS 4417]|uniref:Uncharacterized protein n=1 Tax=Tetrapisispora phaffii (strain ATCC 24235 / CBS 4417 / NBRC 1672 / NRRL Y-8282 / UCD 70-5) TaxID=1071381 RepID=G8BY01_TETPH|nr:hypothetical protein TPHA_0I02780 [Tetrapisispora phaffii CBS 4417]CCE64779.1 hypothetical protein TPHA_0I02780 [Tetrapisispora phaffii CBS 4417]